MPRFPWVSPRRARSTRHSSAEASREASPHDYGLFRNRLFNDEASRNRAELEPIDNLTRSTTPHSAHVTIALGVLAIVVVAWLTLGTVDHSLWLTGQVVDARETTPQQDPGPGNVILIETEVPATDADQLLARMNVYLFKSNSTDNFMSGTVHGVRRQAATASSDRPTVIVQLTIAPDPSSTFLPASPGDVYQLRLPVGTQRPIDLLLRFARPRLGRDP